MKITVLIAIVLAGFAAACARAEAPPVNVQDEAQVRRVVREYLVNDPTVLREALDALAARTDTARRAEIENDARDVSLGPANAPITIVEFFDYRCPYCHAAMEWVFETQRTRSDVRVVFKEFPVLGAPSLEASRAAMASIPQGRYRQFHRALMANREDLTSARIDVLAAESGIDVPRMRRDMANPAIEQHLERNHGQARDSNIDGTPGFLINGELVSGFDRNRLNETLARAAREAREGARGT